MSDNYAKLLDWHPYTPILWPVRVADSYYPYGGDLDDRKGLTPGGLRFSKVERRGHLVDQPGKPPKMVWEYRDRIR